jgi:hypothetical protein
MLLLVVVVVVVGGGDVEGLCLPRWGAWLPGRVICFGVDCPGLLWIESLVEDSVLIGRVYPMLE